MPRRKSKNSQDNNLNTGGGAHVGKGINTGRDFIGRDYNIVTNIYPPYKSNTSVNQANHQEKEYFRIEAQLTSTVIEPIRRILFPVVLILSLMQLLCLPLLLFLEDIWPIVLLPLVVILLLHSWGNFRMENAFRISGFYDNLSVDRRTKLKQELQNKKWGHWLLNLYISMVLGTFVQTDKRKLKTS